MSSSEQPSPFPRLNDDVFLNICDAVRAMPLAKDGNSQRDLQSLKALSQCNQRFRRILVTEILTNIFIHRPHSWPIAQELVHSMRRCDNIRHCTQRLTINLMDTRLPGASMPPAFMDDLVHLLAGMTKLNHLRLEVMEEQQLQALKASMESNSISLSTVRTLHIHHEDLHFVTPRCPNMETVTLGTSARWIPRGHNESQMSLMDHCKISPRMTHFELYARWSRSLLDEILTAMPQLTSLALLGPHYDDKLVNLTPVLSAFKRLKGLALSGPAHLGLGFHPPGCGNAYMGPNGAAVRKKVQTQGAVATEKAVRMCFEACKALEVLWIGERTRATVTRTAGAEVDAVETVSGLCRPKGRLDQSTVGSQSVHS